MQCSFRGLSYCAVNQNQPLKTWQSAKLSILHSSSSLPLKAKHSFSGGQFNRLGKLKKEQVLCKIYQMSSVPLPTVSIYSNLTQNHKNYIMAANHEYFWCCFWKKIAATGVFPSSWLCSQALKQHVLASCFICNCCSQKWQYYLKMVKDDCW